MITKRIICFLLGVLLISASNTPLLATDVLQGSTSQSSNYMELVTEPLPFGFNVVSVGRDSVTAEFSSGGRISTPPYVGIKGTKELAEKTSDDKYVLRYDTEYSFVYNVTEDGVAVVYNSFIRVENGYVVFGDVIRNVTDAEYSRAAGQMLETEPNNMFGEANLTYNDYDNYGAISDFGDTDWWKVTFVVSGTANFWLGNMPDGCDYDIALFNAAGLLMGNSASYGTTQELIQAEVEAQETYYIQITSYSYSASTEHYLFRAKNYPNVDTQSITINFSSNVPSGTKVYIYRENDIYLRDMMIPDGVLVSGNSITIQSYSATWNGASETNNITIGKSYAINIVAPGKAVYVIHPFTIPSSGNCSIDVTLSDRNIIFSSPFPTYTPPNIAWCQNYGYRYNDNIPAEREFHNGIDISKTEGTPIYSISDGIVTYHQISYSPSQEEYVNVIYNQYFIQYVHLQAETGIPAGTSVTPNMVIGKVGTTGNVQAHLHIRTEYNSVSVDPNSLFD